jgi:flagellar protein FlaF
MGFSVSGSAVVLFAGVLVAFGVLSTAAAQYQERVAEAEQSRGERVLAVQNTAITITDATWGGDGVTVTVKNSGSRTVRVSDLDLVLDGSHEAFTFPNSESDLLRPSEVDDLSISDVPTQPTRVKAITALGIADTSGVRSTA